MADISKISFGGTTYNIKDTVARETLSGAIKILGATTTALTDNATTNPITINGESVEAVQNDAVFYESKEFVFDGTYWHEFGDMTGLGDLAQHDLDDIEFTTTVSQATAETTVSQATATTTVATTSDETAAVAPAAEGEATYTPAGTVSQPTFTGDELSSTGTYTPVGTISGTAIGYASGTWDAVKVSVGGTNNETLTIETANQPTITTQGTFTGTTATIEVAGTPTGTVSQPTFSGTGVRLETDAIAVPATFTTTVAEQTASTTVSAQTAETTAAYES